MYYMTSTYDYCASHSSRLVSATYTAGNLSPTSKCKGNLSTFSTAVATSYSILKPKTKNNSAAPYWVYCFEICTPNEPSHVMNKVNGLQHDKLNVISLRMSPMHAWLTGGQVSM